MANLGARNRVIPGCPALARWPSRGDPDPAVASRTRYHLYWAPSE